MNLSTIKTGLSTVAGRAGLKLSKHAPELLLVGGVVAIVGGTVLACKETLKCEDILDDHMDGKDCIEEALALESEDYTEEDAKKDTVALYLRTAGNLAKNYWPSILLVTGGIALVCTSHGILHKRNVALGAAYTALNEGFNKYRERVRADQGEDKDLEYLHGGKVTKEVVVEEDGTTHEEKVIQLEDGEYHPSVYARFFDESSVYWKKRAEDNLVFLHAQQEYANHLLRSRGHLFLNEVYDMLGLPRSEAGCTVGWILRKGTEPSHDVDFGIYNIRREGSRDFVNGLERSILLDFNVDGNIHTLI